MSALEPDVFPRLWTAVSLLAGAGCLAAAVLGWSRDRAVRRRVTAVLGAPDPPESRRWARLMARCRMLPLKEGAGALGATAFAMAMVGTPWGWPLGAGGAYAAWRWLRARTAAEARDGGAAAERRAAEAQLPLTAELMAACLTAGAEPGQAAEAVGRSVGGPLGVRLARVATELRLGGDPSTVWGRFGTCPGSVGFARCMERAATAGVPAAEAVTRLADELRRRRARCAIARARRAAVLVTGPLGLCFLPAFLAIGVLPVVLGLARPLW
ncbi:type II secretion system F family protein [Streptomyces boncukensis]|uniref:Type II secretion system F family protein n=1 Tax=Streptomyces boncukensis TaxID=2711219 RepID=A0A6G4WQL5_9ACTN|nr:type II secretion system F family protein [Streptomyces boncukensis]NGO67122.1 type II secretion system F family protein [Streptomyces boncukensis]